MDIKVVARLAEQATSAADLERTISTAGKGATPEQLLELKAVERKNHYRLAVTRREGNPDFEGRVNEALRVVEALYSMKNGKPTRASRTRQSIARNGTAEAVRRVVAKKDSPGLRILVENDRLDCAFEQIVIDFPSLFQEGNTREIAIATLQRERSLA